MTVERVRDGNRVVDRWNRIFDALAAEPRRQLIASLADVPAGRSVSLPAAAASPTVPDDPDRLRVQLRHHHLPMLADGGYVEWEDDPLRARRGPQFDGVAVVLESLHSRASRIPDRLVEGCQRLEREREEGRAD